MIGQTVSHYKILEKLGEGGMGVVYKAHDTNLERDVALKFLPHYVTSDPTEKERFYHEARAVSALNHPNITTIYEISEHEGQLFIAMEYVEGKTLKELVASEPPSVNKVLDIAVQAGQGLAAAHEKGIVHRDIKSENIMLTPKGQAKIMDFGLAKVKGATKLTKAGSTLGTAAYMSPEQALGEEVDHRSDIFSFGVVLYELLTGKLPFRGEHQSALLYSIIHDEPPPVARFNEKAGDDLQRVVSKALAKDREERYQHIDDMLVDLRALGSSTLTHGLPERRDKRRLKSTVIIAGAVVVVVIALGLAIIPRLFGPATPPHQQRAADHRKMIVVLPFENLGSPDDEYFANGTTDAITARLAGVSGLGVISRQSAMQYKKTTKSIRQIGSELGVDYILEGTVQRERPGNPASRVRVIPQLIRVADDTHVWADTYDDNMAEVFRVQSDIARKVATQLDVALLEPERRAIEKRPTENLAAYEDYLRGFDYYYRFGGVADAELSVQLFETAVSLDPRFVEAWAGLAMADFVLYWRFDQPRALTQQAEAAKRAAELGPDLPETHVALGYVAYAHREFDKALAHFETAQSLGPSGDASQAVGVTLRRLGKWEEALDQFEDARRLMPHSYNVYFDFLGFTNTGVRHFDEAEQACNQAISLAPQISHAYALKAHVLLARDGDVAAAKQVWSEMSRRTDVAEAAESEVNAGHMYTSAFRFVPEIFAEVFDAFASGRMEQVRGEQPSIIATTRLAQGLICDAKGDRRSAAARYDSARVYFERIIRSNPQSAYISVYHADQGLAYAGLGRCEEAIREGEEAVRMIPVSKDAVVGAELVYSLAEIYMKCGKYEAAIDQIETLLSIPSYISPGLLRVDPLWDPIRNNPRFRRLLEEK